MLEKFISSRKKPSTALLMCLLIAGLLTSLLVPWSVFSVQPPIASDVQHVGREGQLAHADLDITGSANETQGYPTTLWYDGQMRIGNGDPLQIEQVGNTSLAIFKYTIHVQRIDSNENVALLTAVIGLKRENGSFMEYGNATTAILAIGGEATVQMDWSEDGSNIATFPQDKTWYIYAETYTVNSDVQDSDLGNNRLYARSTQCLALVGDITGNGIVDIFDAIRLAGAFGSSTGQSRYDAHCDLKKDGTVDIFDAILLAGNFNKHIP